MNIAVTGATGTLGKAIMFRLREAGNSVVGIGTVSYTHLTLPTRRGV